MWRTYFRPLDHRFRLEIINPVQTKVYKFAANEIARSIVGQSRSTIDPLAWVRDGALVVVDVAKEHVGPDIAAMLGGTLVNLVAMAIGQQASLPANERRHVALLVDEFHALPAANYEAFLAELSKYGASVVLATQSLGALDAVDPQRALRHAVFANVDHLLAFNSSAEDARLLALELGTPIEVAELDEIGDYQCYARLSCDGERLPAFHLRLDAPPIGDSVVRDVLAAASAARYGRDAAAVASDRAALLDQLEPPTGLQANSGNGRSRIDPGAGRIPPASAGTVMEPLAFRAKSKRSEKRPRKQSGAVPEGELPQLELGFGQAEFVPSDLETTPGTNSNDAPQ